MADSSFRDTRDPAVLQEGEGRVVLFRPFVPSEAAEGVADTLNSRWIGQGPKVDRFERQFADQLRLRSQAIAVGSGTDALHLALALAGVGPGDEVIAPVFTCTATNLPVLYQGARLRFADIELDSLNISVEHARKLVTERTKAILCVHYGGLPCDMTPLRQLAADAGAVVIEDAAQALGAEYAGEPIGQISEYTTFSFQAIKHITTGDGGMLMLRDHAQAPAARRIRWFGIDREAKFHGHWENDIRELGYKYQMNDIAAAMGLAALPHLEQVLEHRRRLLEAYGAGLQGVPGIEPLGLDKPGRRHAAWLCTVAVEGRKGLERKLRERQIESAQVHFRNDRYTVFAPYREGPLPNMDAMEDRYQVLPLHMQVSVEDVQRICEVIREGW